MAKYKVAGSTKPEFLDIVMELDLGEPAIGDEVSVLGGTFTVTSNISVFVIANKDWVVRLQDVTPPPEPEKPKGLIVNETFDIYAETKEIDVRVDCTYEELYYAIKEEWKFAEELYGIALPVEYETRLKLFTFRDSWNFGESGFVHIKDGSYSRFDQYNRSI